MIGGFRSVLCVSVFQGSLLVIVIMIDGSENAIVNVPSEVLQIQNFESQSKINLEVNI